MIKAIFFLSIISYWNVIGGPPPIIAKITFTEEELVIDGTGLEDTKSVSIRTLENKILKDYEVDNANPEKIVARPMDGSFGPGDKNLYLVITDSEGELFYPITLRSKTSDRAVYKITPKENAKIPNKIVVDEKSEINFSPGDNSGRYFYNYSIYANQAGDLAIKNEDKDLFKIDQEGNLEILGSLKVKGKTLKFNNGVINTLNFENYLFPVLPPNQSQGDFRVKDVVIGVDNNITGVVDFTSSGDMDVATATFHVESSTGRVGIGNATPTYKLDVQGSTNSGIRLRQAAVASNTSGEYFNGMVFEDPGQIKSFGIGYGAGDLFSINSYDGTYRNIFSLNNVGNGVISGSLKVGAYTLPATDGTNGQVLSTNGAGTASWTSGGAGLGDVVGPASSTIDNLASFSSGSGKVIKDSGINSANLPTMEAAAASSNTIILSGGADKTLKTTDYTMPSTIGSPTYVLKSDGTNAVWEQDDLGTQSLISPTRGIATGLLPMFLTADGKIITDSDVEAINVPEMTASPTAANQIIISTGNGKHLTTTFYPISPTIGATGTVLKSDGSGAIWQSEVSVADFITGPASSTQFALARYEDTNGKFLKDSPVLMDDAGNFNFLRVVSTTEFSHPCPSMTQIERDALSTVQLATLKDGDCIFNTDLMETNFRRMGRWGALPVREHWVSGWEYRKADLIHSDPYNVYAAKDFTAGATINDDYFAGNFNFPSVLPVTTCTSRGGDVTFNSGNINVSAGNGLIITKSTTGHSWPDENRVKWNVATSIPPVSPTSWNTAYVDKDGVVRVTSGRPNSTILRTEIVLATFNPSLTQIIDHRGSCFDPGNTIRILNYILGKLIKGFEYFPNADLTMGRNAGEIYGTGINFDGDIPNVLSYPAQPLSTIDFYFDRDSLVASAQTNVDPNRYDNDGSFSPVNTNRYSYQRVYLVMGGGTAIQYGQKSYTSLNAAISGVTHDALLFVENPKLSENAKWIATIVMKGNQITGLNNTLYNAIINCGIFGCSEGVGGGTAAGGGGGGGGDVFGPDSSVINNLAIFSDLSGKFIGDSGINKADLATMATGAVGANQIIISAGAKELSSTIYQIPPAIGASGTVLKSDGSNASWQADNNSGDVLGPASATATNLAAFNGTTGKLIGDSGVKYTDLTTMTTGAVGANQIIISAGGKELSSTIYQIPLTIGSTGTVLKSDGTNAFWQADTDTTQGANDVQGPTSATDNALVRFDTTGNLIQGSGVIISDTNDISGVQNFTSKGSNTNTGAPNTSAVTFMTGRSNSGALNTNQTTADISFEYGAANGGYKHYISTTHSGTASLNSMNFWINNTTVSGSSTPGTGNDLAVSMTPVGVGILTQSPFQELDVQGDIVTSFHGNASQHNAAELGTRMIGHISGTTEFAGMKVNVKALESDGTTARANNADIGFHVWGNSLYGSKEVVRITERGRLGINTTNPSDLLTVNGSVTLNGVGPMAPATLNQGWGAVKVVGPVSNAGGPHMTFNDNSDAWPQRQFLNYAHDSVWDCFDCYHDGSWRNSSQSSSFRWQKTATDLLLSSFNTTGVAQGTAITMVNRFQVNQNGNIYVGNTLTAGTALGANDILGNGDLSRIALEEAKSFNPVTLANCNGWPGGCATNPLSTHPTANGMYLSNANWSGTLYLPVPAASGNAFYYQSNADSTAYLQIDNSNLTSQLAVPRGWTQTFVSDGARWNYTGQKQNGVFNAVRVWPTSTTNIGFGTNGFQLQTDGAGSLTWTAAASDIRLKKDITPLTNAERIINSLLPVEFNWNEQGLKATGQNDKRHVGLIAQDVEKILPGSIRGNKIKIINYDEVTAALVKYVQQLEERIKILENK